MGYFRAERRTFVTVDPANVMLDSNDLSHYPLNDAQPHKDWTRWSKIGFENIGHIFINSFHSVCDSLGT